MYNQTVEQVHLCQHPAHIPYSLHDLHPPVLSALGRVLHMPSEDRTLHLPPSHCCTQVLTPHGLPHLPATSGAATVHDADWSLWHHMLMLSQMRSSTPWRLRRPTHRAGLRDWQPHRATCCSRYTSITLDLESHPWHPTAAAATNSPCRCRQCPAPCGAQSQLG